MARSKDAKWCLSDINTIHRWILAGRMISRWLQYLSINHFSLGWNIILPSESLSPYPSVSAAFRKHQRSFSVQWVMLNTETHNWSKWRASAECPAISRAHLSVSYHFPKEPQRKKGQKDHRSQRSGQGGRCQWETSLLRTQGLHSRTHSYYGCLHDTCKDQASHHPSLGRRGAHDPPTWMRSF